MIGEGGFMPSVVPSRPVAALGLLLFLPALIGAKPAQAPYVVRGDGVVPVVVGGVAGRMRISPWAPAAPTLNPDFADRIGLRGGWFGVAVKVGPVRVNGKSSVTRLQFGPASFRRRVVWFDRRYEAGTDGAVGPGGLPVDIVRFDLRAPQPGETVIAVPLVQQLFRPAVTKVRVGGRDISILFDPQHARTLATAGAGAALAAGLGGQFAGAPGKAEVAFGIDRPVRGMRLARPLQVGPLSITSLDVRTGDNGSIEGIPDADADPEEIVVTARGGNRRDVIIIGRDELGRCSSILFDKPAKLIRLSCS